MRKLNLLLAIIYLTLAVNSIKTASPSDSTTINFIISNPSGLYELCVDSVLIQFTDHVGDIKVITPMPVYARVCICPPSLNSSCLSYASAGKAYGQSYGYKYAPSSMYELAFNIQIGPNPASSLAYPGVSHSYEVGYSYKFVNCKIGCWFENPQQESYSEIVYIRGLTQNEIFMAQEGTRSEQVAANAIADAQQYVSDAFNSTEQAKSTISLALTARCVSALKANSHLSIALGNHSEAMSELIAAQSAYNFKNYNAAEYNATLAKQLAVQAKNEADMATNIIQSEFQRVETISDKLTQANLSASYSLALEKQARAIGVYSYEASVLVSLASEQLNQTDSACDAGEYTLALNSAETTIEKADMAKQLLEPLVRDRLVELLGGYIENLSALKAQLGSFSSNYSNSTIDELAAYRENIQNETSKEYLLHIEMLQATKQIVEETMSAFAELNKTIDRMQNMSVLAGEFKQNVNFLEVDILLQNSVKKLSESDFNSSLNFTYDVDLKLSLLEVGLNDMIGKIEYAKDSIDIAERTIKDVSSEQLFILSPDLSEAENALERAKIALYSQPERANEFARQAKALAIEQRRRMESIKLGIAGVVIIIILLAAIISRIKYPFKTARKPLKEKY